MSSMQGFSDLFYCKAPLVSVVVVPSSSAASSDRNVIFLFCRRYMWRHLSDPSTPPM